MNTISEQDFRHPKDSALMNQILENIVFEKIQNYIIDHDIERIYTYMDTSSCIEINRNMSCSIHDMLVKICDMFDLTDIPLLFVRRDYGSTIEIHGFVRPYIVVSSHFLDRLSQEMLFGALAAQAAGIKAEHHKILFALWTADILSQIMPAFSLLAGAVTNQWRRMRFYTYDRACLLATQDIELTLQLILVNTVSEPKLKWMKCGKEGDIYLNQMQCFLETNSIPKTYYYLFENIDWAPARYYEVRKYYSERGGNLHAE